MKGHLGESAAPKVEQTDKKGKGQKEENKEKKRGKRGKKEKLKKNKRREREGGGFCVGHRGQNDEEFACVSIFRSHTKFLFPLFYLFLLFIIYYY